MATILRWMHFVDNCIFLFLMCCRANLYKCAIRTKFAIKPWFFLNILTPTSKNQPVSDKVWTKNAKICIKNKMVAHWKSNFQTQPISMKHVSNCSLWYHILKKSLQACAPKIACLSSTWSKCFKIVHFSHWRQDFQIDLFTTCQGQYFDSQILQIWYQQKAYTLLSTTNINKSHLLIIMCADLHFIPVSVCRTHQCVYRGQRAKYLFCWSGQPA